MVNPTWIAGPTLASELRSSMQLIKAMLDGALPVAPRARMGVVDVRDVADLHLRAMAGPAAAGKPDLPRPVIHNDRARTELGWAPRPAEVTIVQTAESLRDLSLLGPA